MLHLKWAGEAGLREKEKTKTTAKRDRRESAKRAPLGHSGRRAGKPPSVLAGPSHVTAAGGNVFADLGFPAAEAETLKIRSHLMSEAQRVTAGLTPVEAAEILGVSPSRISELMRGHLDRFTIDELVNMLAHAGVRLRVLLKRTRKSAA